MAKPTAWSKFKMLHEILPGGSPGTDAWTREGDGSRTLTCPKDRSHIRLIVRQEPMARQDRRRGASHRRLVAYCPQCRDVAWRLRVGGPR